MKNINKNTICWCTALGLYALFIFIFSYLYPYGADEYQYAHNNFNLLTAFKAYAESYVTNNPRIGFLIYSVLLALGRWSFLLLNPLLQLTLVLSVFGLIYMRAPDFKTLKDLPAFILISVMSVLFIAKPDNTLFWPGGACNYSWAVIPFIWLMIFLKYIYENRRVPEVSKAGYLLIVFTAFILGMTNENNAPAALLTLCVFTLFCFKAKIKITAPLKIIFPALLAGMAVMFLAPGSYKRMDISLISFFKQAPLLTKIIWHIPKMHDITVSMLLLPVFIPLVMFIEVLAKKTQAFKNNDFIYAALSWALAFILASVLCMAPIMRTTRPFYSASVMVMISFIFLLKYFDAVYKTKLIRCAAWLSAVVFALMLPLFAQPYISLYKQDKIRARYIEKAKAEGADKLYLNLYIPTGGPCSNLQLLYYDLAKHWKASEYLGAEVVIIKPEKEDLKIL